MNQMFKSSEKLNVKSYLIEKDILWEELKKEGFDSDSIVNFIRIVEEHDSMLSKKYRFI